MKKVRKNLKGNYKSDKLSNGSQNIISKKRFLLNDQFAFARFSGDKNPIHLDKIAARRTLHGQCIVHGMHSLLWALDSLAKEKHITSTKIGVRFLKPIFLGEEVYCVWSEINKQLSILISETTFAIIDLEIGEITPNNEILTPIKEVPRSVPRELTFLECSKLSNQPFKIYGDTNLANRLFPSFSDLYGIAIACEIGAISQIVGMECPGLHSLFTGLTVEIKRNNIKPVFGVSKIDKRFNLLKISVNGNTLVAMIESFLRPKPSKNLNISKLSKLVKKNEFKNINALIIGGSRGLGEVVAKLISAGGGESTISYHVGSIEANKVISEIRAWGGRCKMTQLTIDEKSTLPLIDSNINQLYYFASPKILGNISKNVDQKMLSSYQLTYVNYFNNICKQLLSKDSSCSVFYPSTIAIDIPPPGWENYVQAKIEGEKLCMELNKNDKIDIIAPRLPRMDTDLTQSLIIQKSANNAEIMLPFIREMHV
jgi:acyl dehydratase